MQQTIKKICGSAVKNRRLAAVVLINILFLSFFLFFNFNTGFYIDDYGYMFNFSQEQKLINDRVNNLGEVVTSQYAHYNIMNGRSMSHSMLQLFLMLGKDVFNFANTLAYFGLSFGMYCLIKRRGKHEPMLQLLMYLVPWALFPEYGKAFLVCCMSVNYMWTMSVIVLTMLPFKRLFDGNDPFAAHPVIGAVIMLLAGVISGWQSENGSAALLFAIGCMGLYYLIARKKIPAWCITGFAGMCMGFLAMITAPGYSIRKGSYGEYSYVFQFMKISVYHVLPYFYYIMLVLFCLVCLLYFRMAQDRKKRILFMLSAAGAALLCEFACMLVPYSVESECRLAVLFAAVAACLWLAVKCRREKVELADLTVPVMLMITGFVATYAMIASPTFETRSEIQFLILFTCGAARILVDFAAQAIKTLEAEEFSLLLPAMLTVAAVVSLMSTAAITDKNYEQFIAREQYIEEQKAAGVSEISLEPYEIPEDTHIGMFNISINDPEYWINKGTCWYYGIDSVYYIPLQTADAVE